MSGRHMLKCDNVRGIEEGGTKKKKKGSAYQTISAVHRVRKISRNVLCNTQFSLYICGQLRYPALPGNLGSIPAGTDESLMASGKASGQYCSHFTRGLARCFVKSESMASKGLKRSLIVTRQYVQLKTVQPYVGSVLEVSLSNIPLHT